MSTYITPAEADRIDAELGYPRFDPHGDPIPTSQGELPVPAAEEKRQTGTPLSIWPEHHLWRIVHMEHEPPALFNQVTLLGLTPGAQVEVDEHTPGRVLVWSGRQRQALTPAAAELIYIVDAPPESMPLSEVETGFAAELALHLPPARPEQIESLACWAGGVSPRVSLAASARLEGLAEGLSLLAGPPAKAPEGAAPSRTVVRKLVEEAISKLPFTARGRLRTIRSAASRGESVT